MKDTRDKMNKWMIEWKMCKKKRSLIYKIGMYANMKISKEKLLKTHSKHNIYCEMFDAFSFKMGVEQ